MTEDRPDPATEDDATPEERTAGAPTLGEISHTNPYTGEAFGSTQTYSRGQLVAADGGEQTDGLRSSSGAEASDVGAADAAPDGAGEGSARTDTMADVSHEPPEGAAGANAAYQRGNEDAV